MDQLLTSLKLEVVNKVLQCEQVALLETVKRILDLEPGAGMKPTMSKSLGQAEELQHSIDEVFSGLVPPHQDDQV